MTQQTIPNTFFDNNGNLYKIVTRYQGHDISVQKERADDFRFWIDSGKSDGWYASWDDALNAAKRMINPNYIPDTTPAPVEVKPAPEAPQPATKAVKLSTAQTKALQSLDWSDTAQHFHPGVMKSLVNLGFAKYWDRPGAYAIELTEAGLEYVIDYLDEKTTSAAEVKPASEAPTTAIVYVTLKERGVQWSQPRSGKYADHLRANGGHSLAAFVGTDTPEVKPAPVIIRREFVTSQQVTNFSIRPESRNDCQHARINGLFECDYCADCGLITAEYPTPEVKPAATTSPALVETGERVIAITPMELPARIVTAGNCQYRITHHGAIISVEVLNPLSGSWHNAGNYATETQVSNFLARVGKSAPAITRQPQAPARYSPCALTIQWQTLPLLPAPVVKPEAPARPADVKVVHKAHDITAVYGVNHPNEWVVYLNGPMVRGLSFSRFHSAESAIAAAKTHIDIKAAAGIRKGYRGL